MYYASTSVLEAVMTFNIYCYLQMENAALLVPSTPSQHKEACLSNTHSVLSLSLSTTLLHLCPLLLFGPNAYFIK